MHLYGLNLDELIRWWPNGSPFSRLRFFEGTQLSPTSRGELNWLKMHVSGWALARALSSLYSTPGANMHESEFLSTKLKFASLAGVNRREL